MIRKLVERLGREVVFVRHLPKEFGRTPLYVSPDARLMLVMPGREGFEGSLLDAASEFVRPGDVVWDVGGNLGIFTFAAASRCGPEGSVLCIEPDLWLARLIRRSARLKANRGLRVDVLPVAVSDACGVGKFLIAERGRASNALESAGGRGLMGGHRESYLVPILTLDQILESSAPPRFLKIDVEGAEVLVLKGATRLLREVRPTLYFEVGNENNDEVVRILEDADYVMLDPYVPAEERRPLSRCHQSNTLCVPRESFPT